MSSFDPETPNSVTPVGAAAEDSVSGHHEQVKTEAEEEEAVADVEKLRSEFRDKAKNYLVEQTNHIVIPSFSKWFDFSNIHSIEKKSFPDFFNDNANKSPYKSEDVYKNMRDFIVNTFRLNPKEYLTITAVRKNLAGDVTAIIRIHQFLERWGLINYQIDPRTKPSSIGPQYTGHFQVTLDTPTGLVPFIPEHAKIVNNRANGTSLPSPATSDEEPAKTEDLSLNLEVRRNVYTSTSKKTSQIPETTVHYACNVCGKDTTEVRYHNLKIKSYNHNPSSTINNASILCTVCFEQGLFPSNFLSSDFVKLSEVHQSEEWNEQEILLLLEGIELFGTYESSTVNGNINANSNSQWDKIAEHVATKTKEQCLIKFIQLPIEDKFLTKLIGENPKTGSEDSTNDALVEAIVSKLIKEKGGEEVLKQSSAKSLQNSILEQSNLINQIVELTLEKVNHKLKKVDTLSENLTRVENQINLERKQVVIERWVQFEKVQRIKAEKPELADILDDLIKPVKINEINKSVNTINQVSGGESMELDDERNLQSEADKLPISVSQPKSYQYWSG